jgi:hypothetical protein
MGLPSQTGCPLFCGVDLLAQKQFLPTAVRRLVQVHTLNSLQLHLLKMEAEGLFGILVAICQVTWCHIPYTMIITNHSLKCLQQPDTVLYAEPD